MKNNVLLILIFLQGLLSFGQEKFYLDSKWNSVSSINNATYYYTLVYPEQGNTNKVTETIYFISGKIKSLRDYSNYNDKILNGKSKIWYESGQLQNDIDFADGKKNGKSKGWYESGQLKNEIDFADGKENGKLKGWYINGQLQNEIDFVDGKKNGKSKGWYESGKLQNDIDFADGKENGLFLTYWENGKAKRIDKYEMGKLIDGKTFNSEGAETTYYNYAKNPEFPGGVGELSRYLAKELKYPIKSRKNEDEGIVKVSFFVEPNGSISEIKIAKSIIDELDNEAIRVVKNMPNWEPGLLDGQVARFEFLLPVQFKLN